MQEVLPSLIAVFLGGGLSLAGGYLADRRQQRQRWMAAKADVYGQYLAQVKSTLRFARALWAADRDSPAFVEAEVRMTAEEHQRSLAFERLLLMASGPVQQRAHKVNEELWKLLDLALRMTDGSFEEEGLFAALNEFHPAARSELAIPGTGESARPHLMKKSNKAKVTN